MLRNSQAIRLLECDYNYCQSVLKRSLDQLNKISSVPRKIGRYFGPERDSLDDIIAFLTGK
jgi:hypothetical protein